LVVASAMTWIVPFVFAGGDKRKNAKAKALIHTSNAKNFFNFACLLWKYQDKFVSL
jgi:hypothetical protein